ncbi:MAG: ethanolamine ammonia-lyase subunit EutB [Herminiimonas sp.]|nr:ethanolamine ammonia-lyase subunit EutB [Herminiimonas sp.]
MQDTPHQFRFALGTAGHGFADLKALLVKASPARSGNLLAGVAATSAEERMVAQMTLAALPFTVLFNDAVVPYEDDEVTRLIIDSHDAQAFAPLRHLTVGDFRNWLLSEAVDSTILAAAAAVSKLMRNQDLILVAKKCHVVTAIRLQPNHPTDDTSGIAASLLDGLLYGSGDAVIGINPATDSIEQVTHLLHLLGEMIARYAISTQSCVLTHVTNTLVAIDAGANRTRARRC